MSKINRKQEILLELIETIEANEVELVAKLAGRGFDDMMLEEKKNIIREQIRGFLREDSKWK